jgi:hypothetical protein
MVAARRKLEHLYGQSQGDNDAGSDCAMRDTPDLQMNNMSSSNLENKDSPILPRFCSTTLNKMTIYFQTITR